MRHAQGDARESFRQEPRHALALIAIGLALGAAGIYVGETDDAPGAALIGITLMIGAIVLGVRTARRRTS